MTCGKYIAEKPSIRKRYIVTIYSCSECPFCYHDCTVVERLSFVRSRLEGQFPANCPLNDANPLETEATIQWRETGGFK